MTNQEEAYQTRKTAIVTDANTEIGFETAKALYEAGAHVILACTDIDKVQSAITKIKETSVSGKIEASLLDLSSLSAVKTFAETFKQQHQQLDLLVNNASMICTPLNFTADGYESQFGINFLGHFALTGYLYNLLKETKGSRIVNVTSLGYTHGNIDFDNLKAEKSYDSFDAYCQSKLANLSFTVELQRRIDTKGDQVLSLGAHPGLTNTELSRYMNEKEIAPLLARLGTPMEAPQGALSIIHAAISTDVKARGFYGPDTDGGLRGFPAITPIRENALDGVLGKKLWETAEAITGIFFP